MSTCFLRAGYAARFMVAGIGGVGRREVLGGLCDMVNFKRRGGFWVIGDAWGV